MIVCVCKGVPERAVRASIEAGARSLEEVGCATGAGNCCGSCRPAIAAMLAGHRPTCAQAGGCAGCSCGASSAAHREAA